MKCVVYPRMADDGSVKWSWQFETEAGVAIAKSTLVFDEISKCEKELKNVLACAAYSKVVRRNVEVKYIPTVAPAATQPARSVGLVGRLRSAFKG